MTTNLILVGVLLIAASAGSGVAKLLKVPSVMESMSSVGVSPRQVTVLAALEIAGAIGLLLGVWSKPLGIVSAVCLALYFIGAVASHVRTRHSVAELGPAAVIAVIAITTTVLEVAR